MRSPRSSPTKAAKPALGTHSPFTASAHCATITTSHAPPSRPSPARASDTSPSRQPQPSSACRSRPCTDGCAKGSSPADSSPPAPPGRSTSPPSCATAPARPRPDGWLPLAEAATALGLARQTVLHKVQRGELAAVTVQHGKRKGLRIQVNPAKRSEISAPTPRATAQSPTNTGFPTSLQGSRTQCLYTISRLVVVPGGPARAGENG